MSFAPASTTIANVLVKANPETMRMNGAAKMSPHSAAPRDYIEAVQVDWENHDIDEVVSQVRRLLITSGESARHGQFRVWSLQGDPEGPGLIVVEFERQTKFISVEVVADF